MPRFKILLYKYF